MYSSLIQRKRSFIQQIFVEKPSGNAKRLKHWKCSFYVKIFFCLLFVYYLNIFFAFKYSHWTERSYRNEFYSSIEHFDLMQIEEDQKAYLGPPKYVLSNQFVIENKEFCQDSPKAPFPTYSYLLVLVKSFPNNFKQRQAIRLTWGQKHRLDKFNIKLAFVLGQDIVNTSIENESRIHGDLIQIDQIDSHYYSSVKFVMMLRWISEHCFIKNLRRLTNDLKSYVLFVNDDYFIDIDSLLTYLNTINQDPLLTTIERRTFLTGKLFKKSRPERFINHRYYISIADYPFDRYPPYLSTDCFLMSKYNSRLLYLLTQYIRLFPFENIYLSFLTSSSLIQVIENNDLFHSNQFTFDNQTKTVSKFKEIFRRDSSKKTRLKPICYSTYPHDRLIQLWNQIHHTNLTIHFQEK